ncbi:hypothetical protein AKJ38_02720 [candidate division MSBL1 archaeon SCGC-AAA259I14]|uniref:DRTGG domain-containing protein n=2 Tax=candidate division MSBL1 TaxID=215777 RepID=A0A133UR54_9EURY|nr:hypothetical protein AKJ66_00545 [candidate division MSBL1 archaeon SCGC-AAA259E22]KXA96732.1 hypothetical protein AKJ38_02720 [candidate division MSBL1 archaeon SCGC-AAA259I14]
MSRNLSVVSTENGIGKTAFALALGMVAKEHEIEVGYMKPLGTRLRTRYGKPLDEDSVLAKKVLELDSEIEDLNPVIYSETFIEQAMKGREKTVKLRKKILNSYKKLSKNKDLMIIEGGGKLNTGGIINLTDFDIAELFDSDVVLLGQFDSPVDLDDLLDGTARIGKHLLGVIFNAVSEMNLGKIETLVTPLLNSKNIPILGVLPRKKELAGIKVRELSEELGAENITNVSGDASIARFLVGAMTGEDALRYLRRVKDTAFITGGDRSDIQRAALESPGIKCLILTGGFEPPGAIIGKAEEKNIPILVVQSDTLTAVETAEEIIRTGRTRKVQDVEIMKNLIKENIDLDAILKPN